MAVTSGGIDGGEGGDIEGPEEAVVDEEGVLVDIVKRDEDEDGEGEGDAGDFAAAPGGPELVRGAEPADGEEDEAGESELEADFEEAVVGVLDDEVDGGIDLQGWALHAAPEGVVSITEEGALSDEVGDLGPDGGASGERGVAAEEAHEWREEQRG